ncbi:MAG TPA: Uma2 family endonuclease [Pirellulales bacterium]
MSTTESNAAKTPICDGPITSWLFYDDRASIEIPGSVTSFASFRDWTHSDEFPETGRVDFVDGRIHVDLSARELFSHGTVKTAILCEIHAWSEKSRRGFALGSRGRVAVPSARLAVAPDVFYFSKASIKAGRVRLVPKPGADPGHYIELEGPPDLVVEVVSDSSAVKDSQWLLEAYFAAGVPEYWLVDARGDEVLFNIYNPGESAFLAAPVDAEGFRKSRMMSRRLRFTRKRSDFGWWDTDLEVLK